MSSSSTSACGIVEKLLNYLHAHSFFLEPGEDNLVPGTTSCEKVLAAFQFSTVEQAL
jgi:hypothetical protein